MKHAFSAIGFQFSSMADGLLIPGVLQIEPALSQISFQFSSIAEYC